jgi:NAD(P)-dependent dehydrogenase (short-subunit alcohol dehydrogenase family)
MDGLFSVKDKVVLVTGGTAGIGLMIAHALVLRGAKVYVTSRKQKACDYAMKILGSRNAVAFVSDVSNTQGCEFAVNFIKERESKLHVLINNAGTNWFEFFFGSFDFLNFLIGLNL